MFAIAIGKMTNTSGSFLRGKRIRLKGHNMVNFAMRDNYDFSNSIKNPYAKRLKKQITIRIDEDTIQYFKSMSEEQGIPYQSLINLYLRDCVKTGRKLEVSWV